MFQKITCPCVSLLNTTTKTIKIYKFHLGGKVTKSFQTTSLHVTHVTGTIIPILQVRTLKSKEYL